MNYLRGAVSAISAPYQYYKDLNPSTLTGAIDVIVVRRPRNLPDRPPDGPVPPLSDEDTELVCSPFHVRFGKWQVLRPQDKKVDVFVNGQLVPFSMKIGEAGEAFFVFETLEEIPENLATSPILHATSPETNMQARETGRFGALEPEFLDLNATIGTQSRQNTPSPQHSPESSQNDEPTGPGIISRTTQIGKAIINATLEAEKAGTDKLKDKTVMEGMHKENEIPPETEVGPDVKYTDTMVFDMDGYHAAGHGRETSEATLRSSSTHERNASPSDISTMSTMNQTPGPSRTPSPPGTPVSVPFPTSRATSEPPPEHDEEAYAQMSSSQGSTFTKIPRDQQSPDHRHHIPSLPSIRTSAAEEYTWDWGNFPQKTPVRSSFAYSHTPSTSVDLSRKGKGRMSLDHSDTHYAKILPELGAQEELKLTSYGIGGRLTVDKTDPTRFRVFLEGRTMEFELAIVLPEHGLVDAKRGHLGANDEIEDEHRFQESKVDCERFLGDESVVHDDNLVLLWGDKYIRRRDESPLMDALITWRQAALHDQRSLFSSRPTSPSPLSEDESARSEGDEPPAERRPQRAKTDSTLPVDGAGKEPAPTSSSWARWWSRSRRPDIARPEISHTNSEPLTVPGQVQLNIPMKSGSGLQRTSTSVSAPVSDIQDDVEPASPDPRKRFAKTLRLTSDQLKSLHLKSGANSVTFSLSSTGVAACSARLFVWDWTDQIVISDIDGTITKSDALGHVFTMIGRDWTHIGVAKLYTDICRNGYKILYLTSRAIGQADSTREYLKGIKQNNYQLPEGPVIMSPDRLMASLHREVIMRKPEVFKMACLRDIQKLFGGPIHNSFYAGFGNRITDALSYRSVSVPSSRIFTIDSSGEVKMELLELAGYKSSYIHMTDLVDQMFPPINRKMAAEFTDFNYWRAPIQEFPLPDLSPPSPALSARSDTSNQSTFARLRNFSLVSSRQQTLKSLTLPPPATEASQHKSEIYGNETRLRQMTSFERLSNTFANLAASTAGSPHSSTPTLHDSDSEYEEDEDDIEKARRRRQRRQSVASMPGSLPGSNPGSDNEMTFGDDDDDDDDDEEDGYDGQNEDVPDEAFDQAIFAAGEMKNVDYI